MKKDKDEYMQNFEDKLRGMHKEYRELEKQNTELTDLKKMENDIEAKLKEKEKIRLECEKIDKRHKFILDEYLKNKTQHQEMLSEISFLQEQVNSSQLNEFKLRMRQADLREELNELSDETKEAMESQKDEFEETKKILKVSESQK